MNIKNFSIADIESLNLRELFVTQKHLPLSPLRAVSYINNPRAKTNMPVLFTIEEEGQIVAYRTLLPDYFLNGGEKIHFAWLSGNFVAPAYRRKGLSTKLLNEAESAWDGKLMYTNYAPASKAVYDKTEKFALFLTREGKRYYLKSALHSLLKDRIPHSAFLKILDNTINIFHNPSINQLHTSLPPEVSVEETDQIDAKTSELIQRHSEISLFSRGVQEFNWIKNNPWGTSVTSESDFQGSYHFSWQVQNFQNRWFTFEKDDARGFLWITIINEKLSIPYYFSNHQIIDVAARHVIFKAMFEHNIAYTTTRDPVIGPLLGLRKNPFLFSRKMPQHYFAHHRLIPDIPQNSKVFDGDGDCVFT